MWKTFLMDLSNVMVFCGLALGKSEILTIPIVQKFIKSREEVGKAVDVDQIDMALEFLYFAEFLERTGEKDEYGYKIYTRHIPLKAGKLIHDQENKL
jgi:ATP-dependent helicase YprA (DUF1998 family)